MSICLLLGGNSKAQDAFHKEMIEDRTNGFLTNINILINSTFESTRKIMSKINKQVFELNLLSMNYSYNRSSTDIKDDDTIKLLHIDEDQPNLILLQNILKLLQLFCEGHNLSMQNHLREQRLFNNKSHLTVNFIATIAIHFNNYIKFVNSKCLSLGNHLIDFLIECIQGPCSQNQIALSRLRIIEICKDFMAKFQRANDYHCGGFFNEEQITDINNLVTKSSNLLISLVEGVSNDEIINTMCRNLDFNFLLKKLGQEYNELIERVKAKNSKPIVVSSKLGKCFDNDLMEAFNVYILILTLADKSDDINNILNFHKERNMKEVLNFFEMHTGSIEIVFHDELVKVYFPIQPVCRFYFIIYLLILLFNSIIILILFFFFYQFHN